MESKVEIRPVIIPVSEKDRTSGLLSLPQKAHPGKTVILAHGAANDMTNPLMAAFANGLARAGYPVLRFNFLYADRKQKTPDREPLLVSAWAAAQRFVREDSGLGGGEIIAAGKSLGGRIASQMAAQGLLQACRLIFLGYPLHRMGDPSTLHDRHLYQINVPMLFIEGTRDPLCHTGVLRSVLSRLKAPYDLFLVEGGDHSFHTPRSAGTTDEETYARIVEKTLGWLEEPLP